MSPRWQPGMPGMQDGLLLVHCRQRLLCLQGQPVLSHAPDWLPAPLASSGIGWLDGTAVQLHELEQISEELPEGWQWLGLRQLLSQSSEEDAALLSQASQLGTWLREHRFCGACGTALQPMPGERAMQCPACALAAWPRLSPCIIVLVGRGDEILLARSPRFKPGVYSILAGFIEAGESVEQCLHREVQEEVAIKVSNLRYIGSQSWPFPHSLMLGFHADYQSGEICPQPEEIEDAGWFHIDALPPLPDPASISRQLIELYIQQRRQQRQYND